MKATINLEFTDEELRKYAVDVGRRVSLNFIHDSIAHLAALKIPPIPPGFGAVISQALASAFNGAGKEQQTTPEYPKGPVPSSPVDLKSCLSINSDEDPHRDDGWFCCRCSIFNGVQRATCRNCAHDRCDVVVTPPPPAASTPSDPSAH